MSNYTEIKVGKYIIRKYIDGTEFWYLNDHLHRDDGPAVKWADGSEFWYLNGDLHREDGTAIKCPDGTEYWYKNGKLHREDGPALKYANGDEFWYLNFNCFLKQEYKLVSILYRMNCLHA